MNPEFVRNAWLDLTPLRVWSLPLVVLALAIVFNSFGQKAPDELFNWQGLRSLGLGMFAIFAVWGAHKAAQSVTSEVIGGTWDLQRLAEHRPRELLLGKLFGSTVFEWMGAAYGLALFAFGSIPKTAAGAIALDVLTLALGALLLQSLALMFSLSSAAGLRATRRPTNQGARQSGTLVALVMASLWIGPSLFQTLSGEEASKNMVHWWWTMSVSIFMPLTLAMFIGWTLLGAHRLVRSELQEPVSPLPWIGFLAFLTAYIYPFVTGEAASKLHMPSAIFFAVSLIVCGVLFYPVLLGERKDIVRLRSLAAAWSRGDGVGVWTRLPLWLFNMLGYGLSVLGLLVCALLGGSWELWAVVGVAASFGLFMLRDIGWIMGVHLAPNPSRRPDLVVFFFLAVLYGLIPMVIATLGERAVQVLYFFVPGMPVVQAAKAQTASIWLHFLWAFPGFVAAWAFAWPRLRRALKVS